MTKILVTGGNGQLATCMKDIIREYEVKNEYIFLSHNDFDITNEESIDKVIKDHNPQVIVNCAAYTNVENAETEEGKSLAMSINAYIGGLVAKCQDNGTKLIHISTDYVFDGEQFTPYTEEDEVNPLNTYGYSKAIGEALVVKYDGIVIRTSWLYSEYGKNFFNTMYDRVKNNLPTKVVSDQVGSPTYAKDLALVIVNIIENNKYEEKSGIFQYSNEGCCAWYDLAHLIETGINKDMKPADALIKPCTTKEFPQKAKRPLFSIMSKDKFYKAFGDAEKRHWIDALNDCLRNKKKLLEKND